MVRPLFVACAGALLAAATIHSQLSPPRFYPDDPLLRVPPPLPVKTALNRDIDDLYDFLVDSAHPPGPRQYKPVMIPAGAVNTLGEVPDSDWYTNRWRDRPMTLEELARGPHENPPPFMGGPWKVTSAKTIGVTPGFAFTDAHGEKYLVKFDPKSNPEMATACDVVGAHFFYAFGYNVPSNYIVVFAKNQLTIAPGAKFTTPEGRKRLMRLEDVDRILAEVPKTADGRYRGMATAIIHGHLIGPFWYHGTRRDDPNDIVPHQNRRDLRGLYVFAAWLNHTDAKSGNTLDTIVTEDGIPRIKHYLIDFGAIMGSDSTEAKAPLSGHEYFIDYKPGAIRALTLGFWVPDWARADMKSFPAVGHFSAALFDPDCWKNNYPNPTFLDRLPDDEFWAAKQVMRFTPSQIRVMVESGEYSNPEVVSYLTRVLIERQQKIGRVFFAKVLPLDNFTVRGGRLEFEDLAVKYGFTAPRSFTIDWSRYDNNTRQQAPLNGSTFEVPREAFETGARDYFCARIRGADPAKTVAVYLRGGPAPTVVGIDRSW